MSVNIEFYKEVTTYLQLNKVQLIAVSKTKPNEAILDYYFGWPKMLCFNLRPIE